MQSLAEERSRLLREIAQLRASATSLQQQPGGSTLLSATGVAHLRVAQAGTVVGTSSISPSKGRFGAWAASGHTSWLWRSFSSSS